MCSEFYAPATLPSGKDNTASIEKEGWCSWIRASWYNSYRKIQQDATVYHNFIIPYLNEAQHVLGDTPPIIRSLKLHKRTLPDSVQQPLVRQPSTYAKPEAACAVLGSWWWAACRPNHVELKFKIWNNKIVIHCCILLHFSVRSVLWWPDLRTPSQSHSLTSTHWARTATRTAGQQERHTDNFSALPFLES